jgi:hypothetical protein
VKTETWKLISFGTPSEVEKRETYAVLSALDVDVVLAENDTGKELIEGVLKSMEV